MSNKNIGVACKENRYLFLMYKSFLLLSKYNLPNSRLLLTIKTLLSSYQNRNRFHFLFGSHIHHTPYAMFQMLLIGYYQSSTTVYPCCGSTYLTYENPLYCPNIKGIHLASSSHCPSFVPEDILELCTIVKLGCWEATLSPRKVFILPFSIFCPDQKNLVPFSSTCTWLFTQTRS